jgi:hypothetical protein
MFLLFKIHMTTFLIRKSTGFQQPQAFRWFLLRSTQVELLSIRDSCQTHVNNSLRFSVECLTHLNKLNEQCHGKRRPLICVH